MDWYFRRESDDLIVPNDQETADIQCTDVGSPSADDWFQWGVHMVENFQLPNKLISRSIEPSCGELSFDRQSSYVNLESELPLQRGGGSSSHSACEDLSMVDCSGQTSESSFHGHGHLGDWPDYQLQSSMGQMDDIFLNSLLVEDSPDEEILYETSDSAFRLMSFGNLLSDMSTDPWCFQKDPSFMGGFKHHEMWSPPVSADDITEGDKLEDISPSDFVSNNSKGSEGLTMAPNLTFSVPTEQDTSSEIVGHVHKKRCLEATVLQELEDVTTQLNLKTRICFRDALYRLAKVSKQQHSINECKSMNFIVGGDTSKVNGEILCLEKRKTAESKTNAIDRTIANLMFNKPTCGPPDLPSSRAGHQNREASRNSGLYDHILNQQMTPAHFHCLTTM